MTPESLDPTEEALILESIDRFLERDVKPYAHELEATDTYPAEVVEKMMELGLFGATIAPEYGGLGLSARSSSPSLKKSFAPSHQRTGSPASKGREFPVGQ